MFNTHSSNAKHGPLKDQIGGDNVEKAGDVVNNAPVIDSLTKKMDEFVRQHDVDEESKDGEAEIHRVSVMRQPEEGSMCLVGPFGRRQGNKGSFDGRQGFAHNYHPNSRYFGMFSDKGNEFVANFVDKARREGWDWPKTLDAMIEISDTNKDYPEIMDTMVREIVYDAIGATGKFYLDR
jgi:hypothetical protein